MELGMVTLSLVARDPQEIQQINLRWEYPNGHPPGEKLIMLIVTGSGKTRHVAIFANI